MISLGVDFFKLLPVRVVELRAFGLDVFHSLEKFSDILSSAPFSFSSSLGYLLTSSMSLIFRMWSMDQQQCHLGAC